MEKKDERLSQIFDAYFEENKPSPSVTQKAGSYLKEKGARRPRWKPALRFASVFACVVLAFVMLISFLPTRKGAEAPSDNAVSVETYSSSSLKFRSVERSQAVNTASFGFVASDENLTIVSESYYIYYDKTSEEAMFVLARLGILRNGRREDVSVIVELSEKQYDALAEYRRLEDSVTVGDVQVNCRTVALEEEGEYVSNAYFAREEKRFYIEIMSGIRDSLDYYLEEFV